MRTYGVAVHGAGWVAAEHVRAFAADPRARVVAVSSRREESAARVARETSHPDAVIETNLDAVLSRDDVDILSVCTPHDLHPENTIAAADAGKHVLIEKPAALDLASLRAMRDAIAAAGVRTVVSFVLRWNPLFDVIRAQLTNGALGRLFMAEVDYVHGLGPWYAQYEWSRTAAQGRSSFLNAGCHAVDALRYFTDSDIVEVSACAVAGSDRFEYPGTTVMICKFANGALGRRYRTWTTRRRTGSASRFTATRGPCWTTAYSPRSCRVRPTTPRSPPCCRTAAMFPTTHSLARYRTCWTASSAAKSRT